ncbi:MAG: hypothetical protein QOI12_2419 [Alphaproteobacteria bacterium]|jgi:plasmid stabilization system protein ParE|nr:hypothetical protein [Alphaproteobacteria bacterium]
MKVSYSRRALAQVAEIFAYLEEDNPIAAAAVVARIENLVSLLSKYPTIGRTTDKEGVRLMGLRPYP